MARSKYHEHARTDIHVLDCEVYLARIVAMAPLSKKARTTWPVLPNEVIEDIFVRLPANSVLRYRCLS